MKRIFSIIAFLMILAATPAFSQDQPGVVKYPAALDSAASLGEPRNSARTTLSLAVTSTATTLSVITTTGFSDSGFLSIENEIVTYTGKTLNSFTGVTRGRDGTVAAAHALGKNVEMRVIAAYINTLSQALRNAQAKVGIGAELASGAATGEVLTKLSDGSTAWSAVGAGGELIIPYDPVQSAGIGFKDSAGGSTRFGVVGGDSLYMKFSPNLNNAHFILNSGVPVLSMLSSGGVGVGTGSPAGRFHVIPTGGGSRGFIAQSVAGQTEDTFALWDSNNVPGIKMLHNRFRMFNLDSGFGGGSANFERLTIQPVSSVYSVASEAGGTGVARNIQISAPVLDVQSGQSIKRTTVSGNYTILKTDYIIAVTSTAAPRTITLPLASTVTHQVFHIIDESCGASTNNITLTRAGSDPFLDGATTTKVLNVNCSILTVYSTGAAYKVF